MKLKFIYFVLFLFITNLSFAQLKVRETGQIMIGTPMEFASGGYTPLDNDNYTQCIIYGPYGDWRAGSRLAFGDFQRKFCLNVIVGEYTEDDSDQLWLQGKKGTYLTAGTEAKDIWGYYDLNKGNYFQFNCDVRSTGVFVASDSVFKENVKPISNTLPNLKKMNAVSYKLKFSKVINERQNFSKSLTTSSLTLKEQKDKAFFDRVNKTIANQPDRFGFIAQEVQKIYPQLVQKDSTTGYLYVDYLGMVPLAIDAINQLQQKVDAQTDYIDRLEERLVAIENKLSVKKNSKHLTDDVDATTTQIATLNSNVPNPFTSETKVSFFLPETVESAILYVYDMQGKQIKSIPVNERGDSFIMFKAKEFNAGLYIYVMIADGKEVGSYKMILTE